MDFVSHESERSTIFQKINPLDLWTELQLKVEELYDLERQGDKLEEFCVASSSTLNHRLVRKPSNFVQVAILWPCTQLTFVFFWLELRMVSTSLRADLGEKCPYIRLA